MPWRSPNTPPFVIVIRVSGALNVPWLSPLFWVCAVVIGSTACFTLDLRVYIKDIRSCAVVRCVGVCLCVYWYLTVRVRVRVDRFTF